MAAHVNISLPSSVSTQHEMTKFCVFWGTRTKATANLLYFDLELNAGVTYLAWASSETNRRTEQIKTIAKFEDKK